MVVHHVANAIRSPQQAVRSVYCGFIQNQAPLEHPLRLQQAAAATATRATDLSDEEIDRLIEEARAEAQETQER